ncbi:beta-cyclopiazonate dehydrogenase [Podospora aff. communis PSN243]|uniref:Beta-cyclopiazonate dehydrogenase n=1 Tax=Podospora aff. communis PSN243 TaxID=3040156 RepID=A0AAV9GD25_9PEZI|nr:beta-cyclopiazonate dehydrogenase [Podospora aff. communis PSN243]
MRSLSQLSSLCLAAASLAAASSNACSTLNVDVAVVGGGASGAYAAVRLKEDYNKKVVLIEKEKRLGGHVAEYTDPTTGIRFEYGVQQFNDYGPARTFFQRLGITPGPPRANNLIPGRQVVDFKTGVPVNYTFPLPADQTAAFRRFLDAVEPFESYLLPGYWNFPPPGRIPADLLLPFSQFVEKYDIHDAAYTIFQVTGFGAGDWDRAITLYLLSTFPQPMIRAFLGNGTLFVPESQRNHDVYDSIQAHLNNEVLYNSTVEKSDRKPNGHTLWVKNSFSGSCTIVQAKKLIVAIEPTPANMKPFSLDAKEQGVLSKLKYLTVHVGLLTHPSLPIGGQLVNMPPAAAGGNYLALPKPTLIPRFDHMGLNSTVFRAMVIGSGSLSVPEAQDVVRSSINALVAAGSVPNPGSGTVEFKAWANHGSMHAQFSTDDIRKGYINKLYGLQGHRGTWWTGGAFSMQLQSVLWAFDDVLLDKMYG